VVDMAVDDRLKIQFQSHPGEEEWEAYAMGRIASERLERLEEHLLACPPCQATLEHADDFVHTMRSAAPHISHRGKPRSWFYHREKRFPLWVSPQMLALVAGVVLTLVSVAVAAAWRADRPVGPISYVTLAALRDGGTARAPSGKPLELEISRPDLTTQSYSAVVVSMDGRVSWTGSATLVQGKLRSTLPTGLKRGTYWVRLFGQGHAQILEAGLRVE
jgi:hypothetical protein